MMSYFSQQISSLLSHYQVNLITGVPDSLLNGTLDFLESFEGKHLIAANEGNAIAYAVGHYLACRKLPLVYMQNSGLGNALNPLTSLLGSHMNKVPLILMIGWRGKNPETDEPQHRTMGQITPQVLELLSIPYKVIVTPNEDHSDSLHALFQQALEKRQVVALLLGPQMSEKSHTKGFSLGSMTRYQALKEIFDCQRLASSLFLTTTGKLSREFLCLQEKRDDPPLSFLNVGAMGHVSQIALGAATALPQRQVVCLDGDGSALMHLGGLAVLATEAPANMLYLLFNNGAHDSVGGQPTVASSLCFQKISTGMGFKGFRRVTDTKALSEVLDESNELPKPFFCEIVIASGSPDGLPRPSTSPQERMTELITRLTR